MANINGTKGNDTLQGSYNDTLTGGGGNDFYYDVYTITDFGGTGKGVNPSAEVIAEVDTLIFSNSFSAENLQLTQNGNNLEITFIADYSPKVILQNFALENLDNLSKSTGATVDLGNILFNNDGETRITDTLDVFNANSTQSTIFNKNTVTFLNDLSNNVNGFDNSDDVINGQGGDDRIDGKSGDDLLRGGTGNNTLIGGVGNDILNVDSSTGDNILNGDTGDDILNVDFSTGNNILNGDAGDDRVSAGASKGNNFLTGSDGNDYLDTSYVSTNFGYSFIGSSGNNTLNGGAGNDTLRADSPEGNNLLFGDDGNDYLSTSGFNPYRPYFSFNSSGNHTLNGGAGDDTLRAEFSTGNNLLSGDDGNDSLDISGDFVLFGTSAGNFYPSSGNNTLNGGAGDDTLRARYSTGNNLFSGGNGNDSFYLTSLSLDTATSSLVTQTVYGDEGQDLLYVDYSLATLTKSTNRILTRGDDLSSVDYTLSTEGIISTFNPTTNIGEITAGTYRVSYKDIEGLNISGTIYDDNIMGSNGNDTLSWGNGGKDTIDGGQGDDVLSVDYKDSNTLGGITTTFNGATNIGEITAGTNPVSYKNIERLNIFGTTDNDNIVGNSGNDTLSGGNGGKDTIDGGAGDDVLSVNYNNVNTKAIITTFDATTNIGAITAGTNRVDYKNIERLNIFGTAYDDNIVGNNGNDTLFGGGGYDGKDTLIGGVGDDILTGGDGNDTLNGDVGDDILTGGDGNNTLTGGAGNDKFVSNLGYGNNIITDFGGVGKGSNPSATVVASLDTLQFTGSLFTAQNLQLTQNGNNLEITFEGFAGSNKVIVQNFKLENLDNLPATSSRPAISNILFDGQTSTVDSFDVFDANSTQTSLFNRNTVTFLNDLNNNITGFDNSNDVINGQRGDDIIDGKSGNDLLRGGAGNDILIGGVGNDTLVNRVGNDTLEGGTGDDSLNASGSTDNNLLSGSDGNDSLDISGNSKYATNFFDYSYDSRSLGNNTLEGGTGDDSLNAGGSKGNNLLSGGDGNDFLSVFGYSDSYNAINSRSEGNNTLEGGAGNDRLNAGGSKGNNLLSGGDGNDELDISGSSASDYESSSSGNNTLNGGTGDDSLRADYSTGDNLLSGGDGNDTFTVYGAFGKNILIGGDGNDTFTAYGASGKNILTGGNGNDSFYGGTGTDTFVFNSFNEGVDTIYDFNATNELIQVSAAGFGGGLSTGSLKTSQFTIGTSATTSNQRFICDNITGALYFDQDGSASTFTQVKFAQLSGGVTLTEKNFVVV
ncbi:beta strand repeat-containing protein [Nostoc sp.]|uniref:beta strand repeat-containing protein n=1 Tax=Nostoc sp. TaxID=1180 RepID=UPI002FF5883C